MQKKSLHSLRNILIKTLLLFLLISLGLVLLYPTPALSSLSAYNRIFPGRLRLPYGDNPALAYNLSLYDLEAMFASHEISARPKPTDEFRVALIGDSSTWGYLLENSDTLAGQINAANIRLADGRRLRIYNLGYPVMSLTKDLLLLSHALRYQPDLIVWPVTLESFPYDKQLFPPLLQNNPSAVTELIADYDLKIDPGALDLDGKSLVESAMDVRRSLADWLRLQIYGVMWAATGIDQDIPASFPAPVSDLPADLSFHDLQPPQLERGDLAIDVLQAGVRLAGETPILFINEPMFISQGENSDIRYNFYYPRWAYDDYRRLLEQESRQQGWHYLDLWNVIPPAEFTNTAVHLSPNGVQLLARHVIDAIQSIANSAGQTP